MQRKTFLWHKFWKSNGIINISFHFDSDFVFQDKRGFYTQMDSFSALLFTLLLHFWFRMICTAIHKWRYLVVHLKFFRFKIFDQYFDNCRNRYNFSFFENSRRIPFYINSFSQIYLIRLCFWCIFLIRWKIFIHLKFEILPHIWPTNENQRAFFKTVRRSVNRNYVGISKRVQITHIYTTNVECTFNEAFAAIIRPYITIIVSISKWITMNNCVSGLFKTVKFQINIYVTNRLRLDE